MKRTIQLFCILFFFTFSSCSQQSEVEMKETTESWKKYANSAFEIEYPSNWEENTSGQMGTSFILFSPIESESDKFRENINLLEQDLQGQNIDLETYVELSENQVKTLVTKSEILTSERQNNENGEHHKLVYYGKQGAFDLRFEQYFWIVGDKAYILTFTSEKDKYDLYKKMCDKILRTFKMK